MRLPETWAEVRLTDVCELNPRLLAEDRPSDDSPVTFVPMSAVNESAGVIDNPEQRTFSEVAKGYTSFRERDVLFAKVTPCMENGKAAVVGQLVNGLGFGSTEFHVLRPTPAVLPEFVFSFVRQHAFRDRAASAFVGTGGLQRVPPEFLARVKFPLPTVPEQHRIVDLLRKSEVVAKAKQSASEQIDQLVQTAYWEHFGTWYTADGLIDSVRISDCIADSQYGVSEAMEVHGTHAVLRMNSITSSGWLDLTSLKYASLSAKDIASTELQDGDLLFNRTNSKELVGKCALWRPVEGEFSFASYLIRLRLKSDMLPEYLWATLNSAYGKYRLTNSAKQAVSMANVSPTDLGRIMVPLPPLDIQEKFAKFVRAVEALRSQMLSNLEALAELQMIVSQQALTGKLTSAWRNDHANEIAEALETRNQLLRAQGAKIAPNDTVNVKSPAKAELSGWPARHWLLGELSEFQRHVLAAFTTYCQSTGEPLLAEDPDVFARFCDDTAVNESLQAFGTSLGNRIRRTLSQLGALGLIAKVTLPKIDQESGERDYLKVFRPLREDEFTRMSDLQALRKVLSADDDEEHYFLQVQLDYETSERAGAGGKFQVISVEDYEGEDRTQLVDQGRHYASLDELRVDLASALKVAARQVTLEEF